MPCRIDSSVKIRERTAIREAIRAFEKETCIRIVKYEPGHHHNYVNIISTKQGCWSYIGQVGNAQELNLQSGTHCGEVGTVIHEFMHALGVLHEQSR